MTNGMTLREFLEDTHFAAIACSMEGDDPTLAAVQYLNQLAAAQDDLSCCTLVNRMRDRVVEHGFNPAYGAYNDLLDGDEQIEELIRHLIEVNLDEETKKAALEWLERLTLHNSVLVELGLVEGRPRANLAPVPALEAAKQDPSRRPRAAQAPKRTKKSRVRKSAKKSRSTGSKSSKS
jgi:hypothetical protein